MERVKNSQPMGAAVCFLLALLLAVLPGCNLDQAASVGNGLGTIAVLEDEVESIKPILEKLELSDNEKQLVNVAEVKALTAAAELKALLNLERFKDPAAVLDGALKQDFISAAKDARTAIKAAYAVVAPKVKAPPLTEAEHIRLSAFWAGLKDAGRIETEVADKAAITRDYIAKFYLGAKLAIKVLALTKGIVL